MYMHRSSLAFLAVALVFTGISCDTETVEPDVPPDSDFAYDESDFPADYFEYTEHDSRVSLLGIDEALVGTWELDSLYLAGGSVKSPFFGHTLTYSPDGSISQNFSSEQYTGGASGFADCIISGGSLATGRTEVSYFDSLDDDGNVFDSLAMTYLKVYDKTGTAQVECEGLSGDTIGTSHQSAELGTGKFESDSYGIHVPYYYELDPTWSILTLYLGEPDDGVYLAKYSYSRLSDTYPFPDDYIGN